MGRRQRRRPRLDRRHVGRAAGRLRSQRQTLSCRDGRTLAGPLPGTRPPRPAVQLGGLAARRRRRGERPVPRPARPPRLPSEDPLNKPGDARMSMSKVDELGIFSIAVGAILLLLAFALIGLDSGRPWSPALVLVYLI